jgi:hypothetical protein
MEDMMQMAGFIQHVSHEPADDTHDDFKVTVDFVTSREAIRTFMLLDTSIMKRKPSTPPAVKGE